MNKDSEMVVLLKKQNSILTNILQMTQTLNDNNDILLINKCYKDRESIIEDLLKINEQLLFCDAEGTEEIKELDDNNNEILHSIINLDTLNRQVYTTLLENMSNEIQNFKKYSKVHDVYNKQRFNFFS